MAAVVYVARTFDHAPDVLIALLHILPRLPGAFWDDGHLLEEEEHENRRRLTNNWDKEAGKSGRHFFKTEALPHRPQPGET